MPPAFELWTTGQWVEAYLAGRRNICPLPKGAAVGDRIQIVPIDREGQPIYAPGRVPLVRIDAIRPRGRVWDPEVEFTLLGVDG